MSLKELHEEGLELVGANNKAAAEIFNRIVFEGRRGL